MSTAPQCLLLFLLAVLLLAASPAPSLAKKFVVGDKKHWAPNVNYTVWADQYRFHLGDWLVFFYEKGMHDVVRVNETAYAACDASHPISNYSRGRSYAVQLNETGRYYYICSRGHCWGGMKVSLLVEPPPPPPAQTTVAAPLPSSAPARFPNPVWWWARRPALTWLAVAVAVGLGLPFEV